MELIDSHSHIDVAEFARDRDAVLARARAAGVTQQIVPAIAFAGFDGLRMLCQATPGLHPAYGLHPMYLAEHRPEHLIALRQWIERERPVALGECGLDYYVPGLDRNQQGDYFHRQLRLAREFELPVILHARRALDAVLAGLRTLGIRAGVVHSFAGSLEQAKQLWKMGFCIGVGGPVTYPRAQRLRTLVATMPLDFLLLETDAPDQPTFGHRGERNEPARLREVCATVAALRGVDEAEIARATTANCLRLFHLPAAHSVDP